MLAIGFLFSLARFSEGIPDPQRDGNQDSLETLSPLTLALFNLAYVALAYPAGALSDRMRPRSILMAGMAALVAGDLILAREPTITRFSPPKSPCGGRTWR